MAMYLTLTDEILSELEFQDEFILGIFRRFWPSHQFYRLLELEPDWLTAIGKYRDKYLVYFIIHEYDEEPIVPAIIEPTSLIPINTKEIRTVIVDCSNNVSCPKFRTDRLKSSDSDRAMKIWRSRFSKNTGELDKFAEVLDLPF